MRIRCYKTALGLYPREFREKYSAAMEQNFRDILRDEGSRFPLGSRLRMTFHMMWDFVSSLAVAHAQAKRIDLTFALQWIVSNALGVTAGWLLFSQWFFIPDSFRLHVVRIFPLLGSHESISNLLVCALSGWTIGAFQSLAMRERRLPRLWAARTAVAFAIVFLFSPSVGERVLIWFVYRMPASVLFGFSAMTMAAGVLIGLLQSRALKTGIGGSAAWSLASALGCAICIWPLRLFLFPYLPGFTLSLLGGALFGIITAAPIQWLTSPENRRTARSG